MLLTVQRKLTKSSAQIPQTIEVTMANMIIVTDPTTKCACASLALPAPVACAVSVSAAHERPSIMPCPVHQAHMI